MEAQVRDRGSMCGSSYSAVKRSCDRTSSVKETPRKEVKRGQIAKRNVGLPSRSPLRRHQMGSPPIQEWVAGVSLSWRPVETKLLGAARAMMPRYAQLPAHKPKIQELQCIFNRDSQAWDNPRNPSILTNIVFLRLQALQLKNRPLSSLLSTIHSDQSDPSLARHAAAYLSRRRS